MHVLPLGWSEIAFLVWIVVLLPLAAARSGRRLRGAVHAVARRRLYIASIVQQLLFLAIALLVAWASGVRLFAGRAPGIADVMIGVAAVGLGLLQLALGTRTRRRKGGERPVSFVIAPRTRGEYALYVLLCIAAGIGEETTYRGLLFLIILALTGNWWAAAAISAALFGLAHLAQGARASLVVMAFGFVAQLVVRATGGLWVAMGAHAAYDIIAGLWIGALARRDADARVDAELPVADGSTPA